MTLDEIRHILAPDLEKLNSRILTELTSGSPLMDRVVNTYLRSNGKQLRPMVLILCARMFGPVNDDVIASAAAVEILHNASLIHDDVVDEADMRRSRPTINSLWDNHVAVLVGDFFVSTAMQQAISTGNINIINALCYLGKQLSLGEIDQVYNIDTKAFDRNSYFKIISYKTASLFVASAKMGCFARGLSPDDPRICRLAEYAELLGLCFQIRDDIFDYLSEDSVIGKPTGNDLREGKITLPLIHAISDLDPESRRKLVEEISCGSLPADRVREIIRFTVNAGGVEKAFEEMKRLRTRADEILASFPRCDSVEMLSDLFSFTISRDF